MAKTPTEIRSLARQHTERAISVLAGIMDEPQSGAPARIQAAEALLSRGWGKPTQPIAGDEENPLTIQQIVRKIIEPTGNPDS